VSSPVGHYRRALRRALRGETKAYGFALVIWGTGSLAEDKLGSPGAGGSLGYIGGALIAMALVLIAAYGRPVTELATPPSQHFGLGGIHIISVPLSVAAGWLMTEIFAPKWLAFLAAGFVAALAFQVLLGFEVALTWHEGK